MWLLQAIGLLLLFVLGLAALVLFVSVHYNIIVLREAQTDMRVEVAWLWKIFSFVYERGDGRTNFTMRIFGRRRKKKIDKPAQKSESLEDKATKQNKQKQEQEISQDKPSMWRQFLDYPNKPEAVQEIMLLIKRFIRPILPRFLTCKVRLGFEDPGQTGMLVGIGQSLVTMFGWHEQVRIYGDFQQKALKLDLKASGHIRLWSWTWPLVACAVSKPVRVILMPLLFKKHKRKEESHEYKSQQ